MISYYYENVYLLPKYYELDELYVIVYIYIYIYLQVYRENIDGIESFSALIVAYDLDSVDQLSVVNATSSNGTFLMNEIDPETRDKYFHCNSTWVTWFNVLHLMSA